METFFGVELTAIGVAVSVGTVGSWLAADDVAQAVNDGRSIKTYRIRQVEMRCGFINFDSWTKFWPHKK